MAAKKKAQVKGSENRRRTIAGAENSLQEARERYMQFVAERDALNTLCEQQIRAWQHVKEANGKIGTK